MAEVAAGVIAAEQVVSTTIEGGAIAGYAIAKDTMPLKATITQIARAQEDDNNSLALRRSNHTLSVIGKKAYIFGGEIADKELAPNDVHSITLPSSHDEKADYACYPSLPSEEGGEVPASRTGHAACTRDNQIIISGGRDSTGTDIEEDSSLWLWDSSELKWQKLRPNPTSTSSPTPPPGPRHDHSIFPHNGNIVLHGGKSSSGDAMSDTWLFKSSAKSWLQLPSAPAGSTTNAVLADNTLYTITGSSAVSSEVHFLRLTPESTATEWQTVEFPTNPLTPGPLPRVGAGLVSVTTGYGRLYLLYFFGERNGTVTTTSASASASPKSGEKAADPPLYSDIWSLQLPSLSPVPDPHGSTLSSFTPKPAALKDRIRRKLGYEDGGMTWAEVGIEAGEQVAHAGKVHPGPRAWFGADVLEGGRGVVVWGGLNAKGEREGDGWVVRVE